jgi:mannose-6-phosphate isomerase class I
MNQSQNQPKNISFKLLPHQVQKLAKVEPGMIVVCDKGTLWLTESNDLQDYALRPGHSVIIRKKGQVLIEAVNESNLHIIYPN